MARDLELKPLGEVAVWWPGLHCPLHATVVREMADGRVEVVANHPHLDARTVHAQARVTVPRHWIEKWQSPVRRANN